MDKLVYRRQLSGSLRLTFTELWATHITIGLFVVVSIGLLMMSFALNLDIVEGSIAALRIFGFETNPTQSVRDESGEWIAQALSLEGFVVGIQQFVFGASYMLGTFLGLFAAAPLTAGLFAPGRIDLLLSKPVSRPRFLFGHVLGVWLTVLTLATYLVGGVWMIIGIKTGVWGAQFLLGIPIITVMFGVMYSVILVICVLWQSSGLGLISSYGLIFVSLILMGYENIVEQLTGVGRAIFIGLYHALPNFIEVIPIMAQLSDSEAVNSWYPLISSILFGVVIYGLSFLFFSRKDY